MTNPCTDTCAINPQSAAGNERPFDPGPGKHVLYFGDPMCSWCWGFAPELRQIHDAIQDRAQFHLVMGGLRPGTSDAWDGAMRRDIRHHWQDVQDKSGQPFDFARFDDETFVYDTEPACRALVSVRMLAPDMALSFYESLQRAFYAEGLNIVDPTLLADLAQAQGLTREAFTRHFTEAEARTQVAFDFNRTRAFGVSGFPTVLCADNGQYAFLTLGYRPFTTLAELLQEWLNA
ncbi:MAG: DsbA family protein [Rhodospirillales bacterium]|nr:DsbA family protein [Rhodospirillales bacterium]